MSEGMSTGRLEAAPRHVVAVRVYSRVIVSFDASRLSGSEHVDLSGTRLSRQSAPGFRH